VGFAHHFDPSTAKRYTICDGRLVLRVEEAEEGGFVVTSPMDPALITQGETISECFANARDALKALRQSRSKLIRKSKQGRQECLPHR
jgi:predicted RNase H-like HicB family nuclease